jgi:maltose alpha-D-glucosyltransferase/alpha-amylase
MKTHPAMIDLWYKTAQIYSLDVETFCDANGDGVGDFQGLESKLDYLASLNINCIWLLPFYPSPNHDNGYDVLDYYGVMLAEANITPAEVDDHFGAGDQLQMIFNFLVNQQLFLALATETARPVAAAYAQLPAIPSICHWANFLRNHDELDLARLTDDERAIVFSSFAPDPTMRLFERGIRRRLAPMLGGDRRRLELAYSLMLTLPGVPVLWYGDGLEGRDSVRTPMQWSDRPNGGFSSAWPDRLIRPVLDRGPYDYRHVNVEAQRRDPDSLLSWLERALRVRRECREFGWGEVEFIDGGSPAVLVHRCRTDDTSVLILHNLSRTAQAVDVPLRPGRAAHDLLSNRFDPVAKGAVRLELAPYEYRWFRESHMAGT